MVFEGVTHHFNGASFYPMILKTQGIRTRFYQYKKGVEPAKHTIIFETECEIYI